MGNPGRDVLNLKADDVLTPKRQKEITEVVALLKNFKLTKIAIEVPPENTAINEKYTRYVGGNYQLTRDEVDQIGFRLAKESGHKKLHHIDWKGNFDFDKVMTFATANNQKGIIEKGMAVGQAHLAEVDRLLKTGTVRDALRWMNSDQNVNEGHQFYMSLTGVGRDKEYVGTDLLADWYERNLKMYANLTRITESPDERILIIIGAGHAKLLQQFITDSGEYELEKVDKYL